MTTSSQLPTTEPEKQNQKRTNRTTRRGTESQKQRSHGGLSVGRGENGGKGTGNKKHKWQVQNRQREVKDSIGNGKAKELICMTYGYELQRGSARGNRGTRWGSEGRKLGHL